MEHSENFRLHMHLMRDTYNAAVVEQKKRSERVEAARFNNQNAANQKKIQWQSQVAEQLKEDDVIR